MTTLTPRQSEILALVADGLTNAEAGRRLGISGNAVKEHLARIATKLGYGWGEATRTKLALWYVQQPEGALVLLDIARRPDASTNVAWRDDLVGGCLVFANQQSALAALQSGEGERGPEGTF